MQMKTQDIYFNKVTVLLHLRMRNVVWSEWQALFPRHSRPLSMKTFTLTKWQFYYIYAWEMLCGQKDKHFLHVTQDLFLWTLISYFSQ